MLKKSLTALAAFMFAAFQISAKSDSLTVRINNAGIDVGYRASVIVNGKTKTIKNKTITASEGNELAVLVTGGGKLILDHCTIIKTGDGVLSQTNGRQAPPQGMRPEGGGRPPQMGGDGQRPMRRPDGMGGPGGPGGRPNGQRPSGDKQGGKGPQGMRPEGMGGPGGPGGDDSFNFYGTNSAVVAIGEGSTIEMIGCTVKTSAEYANAVVAIDDAQISISEGINISTKKNSSRGLFSTYAGQIIAACKANISTQGEHCAALATDRGGGTVIVGAEGSENRSIFHTSGDGSPCIYSTGNIAAFNAEGAADASQTMVVEGKNTISVASCDFSGNSPEHGGIMLYQSMSGDADKGTSTLNMQNCTIRNLGSSPMILVTNTHTVVNMDNCNLLDAQGNALAEQSPLVTCKNCNTEARKWGEAGSNGGQIELNVKNQTLSGTLTAAETDSEISLTADASASVAKVVSAEGNGKINR